MNIDDIMNYFTVSFIYPGPYVNCPDNDQETRDNWDKVTQVEHLMEKNGMQSCHEYSWPDGSCYLNIRTPLQAKQLREQLAGILQGTPFLVEKLYEFRPESERSSRERVNVIRLLQKYAKRKRALPCKERYVHEGNVK